VKAHHLALAERYQDALCRHLQRAHPKTIDLAQGLGHEAITLGLHTLDLAKLHEKTLLTKIFPEAHRRHHRSLTKEASLFFAAAMASAYDPQKNVAKTTARLKKVVSTLSRRTIDLAATNQELAHEIVHRKATETKLVKNEHNYARLLQQSNRMQIQLRHLSRDLISAQEDERRKISRELHDVIAQTLTGINLRLDILKKKASLDSKDISRNIELTQRLVEKSVDIVHRFARELRPTALDDLGLIPALHSFMKSYTRNTGILTGLTAWAGVEKLNSERRTVLYRVAQEALTNVSRHAKAKRVDIIIRELPSGIEMSIKDDGKSFLVDHALEGHGSKRLGLLGMRERIEMVGGAFSIRSLPGHGTTVCTQIPKRKKPVPKGQHS
jgi:signal transduction histidine kinase